MSESITETALVIGKKNPTFNCIIDNRLYLGELDCLDDIENYPIDVIVNVTKTVKEELKEKGIPVLQIMIDDDRRVKINEYFDLFNNFCECHQNKRILIVCQNSVSRSVSFTIYYVMKHMGFDFENALTYVKEKRTQYTNPNIGFTRILKAVTFS